MNKVLIQSTTYHFMIYVLLFYLGCFLKDCCYEKSGPSSTIAPCGRTNAISYLRLQVYEYQYSQISHRGSKGIVKKQLWYIMEILRREDGKWI